MGNEIESIEGKIAVPKTLESSFASSILPKDPAYVHHKPTTILGKIGNVAKRSLIFTAPAVSLASAGNLVPLMVNHGHVYLGDPQAGMILMQTGGYTISMMLGLLASAMVAVDTSVGRRAFTPLPPTKRFLEIEEANQKSLISPFADWDKVFSKNHQGKLGTSS